jgi:hypothetical protein
MRKELSTPYSLAAWLANCKVTKPDVALNLAAVQPLLVCLVFS